MASREEIMEALLAACAAAAEFQTVTRVVMSDPAFAPTVTVATPPEQPAIILLEDVEDHAHPGGQGAPAVRTLNVMLMIWAKKPRDPANPNAPDNRSTGATLINTLLGAIETALAPDDMIRRVFTLGKRVQRCWIEGKVVKESGDLNPEGQAFLAIPLSILMI